MLNEPVDAPTVKTVIGADGMLRRRFTVAEVWSMIEHGIIDPDERFELIDGEFFPMSPKYDPHERIKHVLTRALGRVIDDALFVAVETTLYLDDATFFEPDIIVFPSRLRTEEVGGADVLIAIEIADSSLRRDRDIKAPRYAQAGVPLFALIDVNARTITVHEAPVDGVWSRVRVLTGTDELTVAGAAGLLVPSRRRDLTAHHGPSVRPARLNRYGSTASPSIRVSQCRCGPVDVSDVE